MEAPADDFYGFPQFPFHVHLGLRFLRPEPGGPAVVVLPASPAWTHPDGRQSTVAVYTAGEVAAGIAVCDALVRPALEARTELLPLVLTRETTFEPRRAGRGDIRSDARFAGDADAAVARLRKSRKATVAAEVRLFGGDGALAGEMEVRFYVRLMEPARLEAMASMVPRPARA